MFKVSWTQATKAQKITLIARAGSFLTVGPLAMQPSSIKVDLGLLPFYGEAVRLVRFSGALVMDHARTTTIYALDNGDVLSVLTGGGDAIHAINQDIGLVLNAGNVLDYLRFFCFFVRGSEGPFYIIGDETDPAITPTVLEQDVSDAMDWPGAKLADVIAPPAVMEANPDGSFSCAALVYYYTAIYASDFTVFPSGHVHMDDDNILTNDIPALAEIGV